MRYRTTDTAITTAGMATTRADTGEEGTTTEGTTIVRTNRDTISMAIRAMAIAIQRRKTPEIAVLVWELPAVPAAYSICASIDMIPNSPQFA